MDGIGKVTAATRKAKTRGWRGLAGDWVRPAVICGLGVAAFTQLSGIEMMIYYAPAILERAGFAPDSALLSSMGIAAVCLMMTCIGLVVVDRVGRRRLSLLIYMAFNSGGLQVVGWLTGSEVYPFSVRGAGTSAQAGMVWGADLLVTATALTLVQSEQKAQCTSA